METSQNHDLGTIKLREYGNFSEFHNIELLLRVQHQFIL